MKTNIAFDSEKMDAVFISKNVNGSDEQEVLQHLLDDTGFKYDYRYGNYLIIPAVSSEQDKSLADRYLLAGQLTDGESLEPLPWANIYIPEKNRLISSKMDGRFVYSDEEPEQVHLVISHIGYHPLDTTVDVPDQGYELPLRLTRKSNLLDQVNIEAVHTDLLETGTDAGHTSINPARMINLPNFGETDIFSTLGLLPGISYSGKSSGLNIRGGYGDQNMVTFDGFTLYNLDHFFGAFSSLNPAVVKDMQVYKGGYGSCYGERVSGIVDINGKTGDDLSPVIMGGVNLLSANLAAVMPVSEKLNIVAAGRKGYSSIFSNYLMENIYEVQDDPPGDRERVFADKKIKPGYHFYDLNLKISYNLSKKEKISVTAYGGSDHLNVTDLTGNSLISARITDESNWSNFGIGASWQKQWNSKYSSTLHAGSSGYHNRYFNQISYIQDPQDNFKAPGDTLEKSVLSTEINKLTDLYLSFRNEYKITSGNHLNFGILVRNNQILRTTDPSDDFVPYETDNTSWLYTAYLEDKIQSGKGLVIRPGFRVNYYLNTRNVYLEPRLSAHYTSPAGVTFKFATGRYYQFINKISSDQSYGYNRDFWVLTGKSAHPVLSSNHFILGTGFRRDNLSMDIEGYYKTYDGLQNLLYITGDPPAPPEPDVIPPDQVNNPVIITTATILTGTGRSYGIDMLLKYQLNNYESWLSWSLGRGLQNFPGINGGDDIPAPYDQPATLDWTNLYTLKNWNFSTLYTFSTGQPYIAYEISNATLETGRFYNRLPDYHRVDVSANYSFRIGKVSVKTGVSVINLLNKKNYYDIDRRSFTFNNTRFEETCITRSQGITPNLFVHFRF